MHAQGAISALLLLAAGLVPSLRAQQSLMDAAGEAGPAASSATFTTALRRAPAVEPELRPGLDAADWTLLGTAAAFRYLDYQTTVKAMSDPANFHEVILPQALVDNHAGLGAFEASTVVANYWIYRVLVRHGHRRLARAGQVINLGALAGTVAYNEYNLAKYYP